MNGVWIKCPAALGLLPVYDTSTPHYPPRSPDFAVRCSKHGVDRRGSYRMGLEGALSTLKVQFYRHLAILAHNTLFAFDGFLRIGFVHLSPLYRLSNDP